MAPQLDVAVQLQTEHDHSVSSSSGGGGGGDDGGTHSYWDAPVESSLIRQSASTVDIALLESNNSERHQEKKTSYWDAPTETGLVGKTVSKIDLDTLDHHDDGEDYWGEAEVCDSLQGKTVSELSLNKLQKQRPDDQKKDTDMNHSASFFDWKVKEIKRTLSKLSLSNLLGGSSNVVHDSDDDLDRTRGVSHPPQNDTTKQQPGRITTKTHKLRDTFRKSLSRMSNMSLASLDESGSGHSSRSNSRNRKTKKYKSNTSKLPLDASSGSNASNFSVGNEANMF